VGKSKSPTTTRRRGAHDIALATADMALEALNVMATSSGSALTREANSARSSSVRSHHSSHGLPCSCQVAVKSSMAAWTGRPSAPCEHEFR